MKRMLSASLESHLKRILTQNSRTLCAWRSMQRVKMIPIMRSHAFLHSARPICSCRWIDSSTRIIRTPSLILMDRHGRVRIRDLRNAPRYSSCSRYIEIMSLTLHRETNVIVKIDRTPYVSHDNFISLAY